MCVFDCVCVRIYVDRRENERVSMCVRDIIKKKTKEGKREKNNKQNKMKSVKENQDCIAFGYVADVH